MASLPDLRDTLQGEEKKLYDEMLARRQEAGGRLGGPYVPLMHHPELAQKIEAVGYYQKFMPDDAFDHQMDMGVDDRSRIGMDASAIGRSLTT